MDETHDHLVFHNMRKSFHVNRHYAKGYKTISLHYELMSRSLKKADESLPRVERGPKL